MPLQHRGTVEVSGIHLAQKDLALTCRRELRLGRTENTNHVTAIGTGVLQLRTALRERAFPGTGREWHRRMATGRRKKRKIERAVAEEHLQRAAILATHGTPGADAQAVVVAVEPAGPKLGVQARQPARRIQLEAFERVVARHPFPHHVAMARHLPILQRVAGRLSPWDLPGHHGASPVATCRRIASSVALSRRSQMASLAKARKRWRSASARPLATSIARFMGVARAATSVPARRSNSATKAGHASAVRSTDAIAAASIDAAVRRSAACG